MLHGNGAQPHKGHSSPQFLVRVYYGKLAGWIKMPPGTEVGLSAGDIVRQHVQIARRFKPSTVLWAFHTMQSSSSMLGSHPAVHRCLNGRAPLYLSDYCVPTAGADTRRELCSSNFKFNFNFNLSRFTCA